MYIAYVFLSVMLIVFACLCLLMFKVLKRQCLKKIHVEISRGIKFDSEFYNTTAYREKKLSKQNEASIKTR